MFFAFLERIRDLMMTVLVFYFKTKNKDLSFEIYHYYYYYGALLELLSIILNNNYKPNSHLSFEFFMFFPLDQIEIDISPS